MTRINAQGRRHDVRESGRSASCVSKRGTAHLQARVKCRISEVTSHDEDGNVKNDVQLVETTVGRVLLCEIVPQGLPFDLVNQADDEEGDLAQSDQRSAIARSV